MSTISAGPPVQTDGAAVSKTDPALDISVDTNHARDLKAIKFILTAILILMLASATYVAKDVLLPLVLGLLIFLVLSPLVRWLGRRGVPEPLSAVVIVLSLTFAIIAAAVTLSGPVTTMIDQAPEISREVRSKLSGLIGAVEAVTEASKQVEDMASGATNGNQTQRVVVDQPGLLNAAVSNLASTGSSIVAAMILALFLLSSGDMFLRKSIEAVPRLTDKRRIFNIGRDIERQISRYLGAITLINAGLGLTVWAALWLLGMPYAHLWGAGAFALNFIPFIGAILGAGVIAAVALVTFDTASQALFVPAVYLALTSIEGQIITPSLVGRRLELNTVAVFVTVIFWIWIWGLMGALLAVPFLVLLKVICDNVEGLSTFGQFLGNEKAS